MPQKNKIQTQNLYGFPGPVSKQNPPAIVAQRAPTSLDTGFDLGQGWVHEGVAVYALEQVSGGSATWAVLGGASSAVSSLSGDSGTATPAAGNIQIATGANLTSSGAASAITISTDAVMSGFTSITSSAFRGGVFTTSVSDGAKSTEFSDNLLTAIGSDVNIDIALIPKGSGVVSSTSNISILTPGTGLQVKGGTDTDKIGNTTLVNGTITIANTNTTANSRIYVQRTSVNASTQLGELSAVITPGVSFDVSSRDLAVPANIIAGDQSSIDYIIVEQT